MKKLVILVFAVLILAIPVLSTLGELPSYERLGISVDSHSEWTNSLIKLSPGEVITMIVEQRIRYSKSSDLTGPAGIEEKAGATFPCPNVNKYSLVGKLGKEGECFAIGNSIEFLPKEENFFYFAINDDNYKDNSGKFQINMEIDRPTCGDNICAASEIGFCKEDCEWCGDEVCSEKEQCNVCSADCGFCEDDSSELSKLVDRFLDYRSKNDFQNILAITKDPVREVFQSYSEFQSSFEKKSSFSEDEKENELLPKHDFGTPNVEIEEIEGNSATVNASTNEGDLKISFTKAGNWFIKDSFESGEWLSKIDLTSIKSEQEEYIDNVTEEIYKESNVAASETKFPFKTVLFILLTIAIFFIIIMGAVSLRKRMPQIKIKTKKIEEPKVVETSATKKCTSCGSAIKMDDAFCTTCGTRNQKKR